MSKIALPWICAGVLIAANLVLYATSARTSSNLERARAEHREVGMVRDQATLLESGELRVWKDEVDRMSKEAQDVKRLKEILAELHADKQRLSEELRVAHAMIREAQSHLQLAGPRENGHVPVAHRNFDAERHACLSHLRQLSAAKQQWALENYQPANAVPAFRDVAAYLPGTANQLCPAGGTYNLNSIATNPSCSLPEHALER